MKKAKGKNQKVEVEGASSFLQFRFLLCALTTLSLCASVVTFRAQTGGSYEIKQSVIASGGGASSGSSTFTHDGTIGQSIAGNALVGGDFSVTSGFWNFTSPPITAEGIEGDVAPRPTGNLIVQSNDVVQVQRFLIGLDMPFQSNEFQRSDSAPFATRGDAAIQSNDVIQTQRYLIGLDAQQPAAGPTASSVFALPITEELAAKMSETGPERRAQAVAPEVRVENASAGAGQQVTVNIRVDAIGNESAYDFRLHYNQTTFPTTPTTAIGTAGGTRLCNTTSFPGEVRCSIANFPDNNPTSSTPEIGEVHAGDNQLLMTVTFTVGASAPAGVTALTLTNVNASDDAAQSISPTVTNGTMTVIGPTAASASIGGRILTAGGYGIRSARLSLLNVSTGDAFEALTNSFGNYRFGGIVVGQTYILTVNAKGYTFEPNTRVITLLDDLTDENFVALENQQ